LANRDGIKALTYSVEEAASAAGCGRDVMYELVNSGRVPHIRYGQKVRIPVTALHWWLVNEAFLQIGRVEVPGNIEVK